MEITISSGSLSQGVWLLARVEVVLLFSEIGKFRRINGVTCRIKMGRGRGSLEDAFLQAVSDFMGRRGVVGLPAVRTSGPSSLHLQHELKRKVQK
jgi:hypothetical protein